MWDRVSTGLITTAALVIAAALVRREFFAGPTSAPTGATYLREWRDILPATRLVAGTQEAPVTIVEFTDFECPACKMFHSTIRTVLAKYSEKVSFSVVHFPLSAHKSAARAARASECAYTVGKFAEAIDLLFANQDSLSRADWPWFTARIPDEHRVEFDHCMADSATPLKISEGIDAGARLGLRGTPVVLLNGWRYPGAPPDTEFVRAVDDLVAGRKPYPRFPASSIRAPRSPTETK